MQIKQFYINMTSICKQAPKHIYNILWSILHVWQMTLSNLEETSSFLILIATHIMQYYVMTWTHHTLLCNATLFFSFGIYNYIYIYSLLLN